MDSIYYGKLVFTTLNIVQYNIFGKGGPNLYGEPKRGVVYCTMHAFSIGVEPWSFYFVNGFLNFNVVFILALMAVPLVEMKVKTAIACMKVGGLCPLTSLSHRC